MMEKNDKTSVEQQQLAWSQEIPHYGDKLLKRLEEFRKTTILYDIRVRANGGEFNAHKVILAACGGMFRTCFIDENTKMISSSITELKLDCPAQGLKPIVKFAYTGALIVTKKNAVATMIAAEVTKMKEVQEICADIAMKEYGWIISFTGDKDSDAIEKIQAVLTAHSTCFKSSEEDTVTQENFGEDLPFLEELKSSSPDSVSTYRKLAICLTKARALLGDSKPNDVSEESDKSNSKISDVVASETTTLQKDEKPDGVITNGTVESTAESITVTDASENTTPKDSKPTESVTIRNVPASPPSRKPRSSVKAKAAPPPPPSPKQRENAPKSPASLPPPRPHKLPTKVPPPRPKPPAKKKNSAEEGNATQIDYDDSLNPFA